MARGLPLLLIICGTPFLCGCDGSRNSSAATNSTKPRIRIGPLGPDRVDLGSLENGTRRNFSVRFENPTAGQLRISDISGSCPCVSADNLPLIISDGGSTDVLIVVDLTEHLEFQGILDLDLTAFDNSQEEPKSLFSFTARVRVIPGNGKANAETHSILAPIAMGLEMSTSTQPFIEVEGP